MTGETERGPALPDQMTGPGHYGHALALLDMASEEDFGTEAERFYLAKAQVHATLALAAATALARVDVMPVWDARRLAVRGRHGAEAVRARQRAHAMTGVRTREVIWSWLVIHPGRTAFEIARAALGHTGPTGGSTDAGSVRLLLKKMEKEGQVTRVAEYRAQQGREVSLWYAAPGAFRIGEAQEATP